MARQATRRGNSAPLEVTEIFNRRLREAMTIALSAFALFLLLALLSFNASDPGWSHTQTQAHIQNITGAVGAFLADVFFTLFGLFGYFFPVMVGLSAWLILRDEKRVILLGSHLWALRIIGFVMSLLTGCAILSLHFNSLSHLPLGAGGILGHVVSDALLGSFNGVGSSVLLLAFFSTGLTLIFGLSWLTLCDVLGRWTMEGFAWLVKNLMQRTERKRTFEEADREPVFEENPRQHNVRKEPDIQLPKKRASKTEPDLIQVLDPVKPRPPLIGEDKQQPLFNKPKLLSAAKPAVMHQAGLPPLDLLEEASVQPNNAYTESELAELSKLVETRLADFGIEVHVVSVNPGPVITRFELQLAPGVKVSKLVGLAKDIARSLSVISVRVVEVIPGKSYVGLEIPNRHREMVRLREILESAAYQEMEAPLCMALGKDISGEPIVVDLSKMPHLLVAGTTGSGKSVGVNAMLVSILYKSTPDRVRMILIDPKMLELSIYEGIPHLLTPVVTDMKDAAAALRWCVAEMERRYKILAALGVRNLASYNRKVEEALARGEKLADPLSANTADLPAAELTCLPHIVVVVDEFADMIMVVGKKVEELIARIAQKARAAGIHLILATQRPSVDVITGLIKANVPTRIAFQVSSRIDSRTILDQQGAEALLGHGDMLYLAPGTGIPTRVHGAFVADEEVHRIVKDWKERGEPHYIESITAAADEDEDGEGGDEGSESDELYDKAVYIVTDSRKASISYLQRRLKVGYNRAARLIEEMERQGVVGSMQSGGVREVMAPPPVKSINEDMY